jgi:diguanylate cyclase (GGDEF)-like protein
MRWSGNGPIGCACALKPERAKDFHLCLPIVDREATLGMLHLRPVAAGWPGEAEAYERLAETVAESLGLAWGNLRLHETLREQSVRDPLTGLFNRRYLEATAERELGRAERQGHALGLVLIDLDYLKHYNDTYGHRAGDTLLRSVARLLASNTRASDVASRLGGDEFCLILAEATLPSTLERAEQLRAALNRMSVQHDGRDLGQVTVSMGVAAYPEHGLDWPRLFEAADQALYRAKAEGRNELRVAREPNPPAPRFAPEREGGAF